LTVLVGGAAFAAVEPGHLSTWDGAWWAITTMTTVGYGDVYPRTTAGRVIAVLVMLVGIGFIALLTGAVAERFLARDVAEAEEAVEDLTETDEEIVRELVQSQTGCSRSRQA
jgi:voltage-gated potassium channel